MYSTIGGYISCLTDVVLQQCNLFNDWNSVVTVKSHQNLAIQGPIVRLMACSDLNYNPPHIQYEKYHLVPTPEFNIVDGDDFPPRNKGYSVDYWLNGNQSNQPHDDDVIVLMDPDQLIINHLDVSKVVHGKGLAAGYSLSPGFFTKAKPFCDGACDNIVDPSAILYGAPYITTAADLRRIAPIWNMFTEVFRKQEPLKDWLTEMYSYIVAAVKLGIHFDVQGLMISNVGDENEPWHLVRWHAGISPPLRFIHFCQRYEVGELSWMKHDFHSLDLRSCERTLLFNEPKGNDRLVLEALEGTPLALTDKLTQTQLHQARSAYMYKTVSCYTTLF